MARKQKIFNYEFADGPQQIPSSYRAKCNKTGDIVPIYHKVLYQMILTKYKNKFNVFLKNFVKKGADVRIDIDENGNEVADKHKLNAYSDYLIISYKALDESKVDKNDQKAYFKFLRDKSHIEDCFKRHFNRDINQYLKEQQ